MARAQRYREKSKPFIEGVAKEVHELPGENAFDRGERVFHQKFGYGEILAVEGEKLTIAFDKAGEKKVMASFLVPADAAG